MWTEKRFNYIDLDKILRQNFNEWLTPEAGEFIKKHLAAEEGLTSTSIIEIGVSVGYDFKHQTRVTIIRPHGAPVIVGVYSFSDSWEDFCLSHEDDKDYENEAPWCIRL